MRRYKLATALLFACLAACASQTSTLQAPSGLKCTIDLKRICQDRMQAIRASQINQGGKPVDEAMLEANSQPTTTLSVALSQASGEQELSCSINTRTRKVVYASLDRSLTDADIAKLRIDGYCAEGAAE
jgi:hypothetical protein